MISNEKALVSMLIAGVLFAIGAPFLMIWAVNLLGIPLPLTFSTWIGMAIIYLLLSK
jgi:hypothetical protein